VSPVCHDGEAGQCQLDDVLGSSRRCSPWRRPMSVNAHDRCRGPEPPVSIGDARQPHAGPPCSRLLLGSSLRKEPPGGWDSPGWTLTANALPLRHGRLPRVYPLRIQGVRVSGLGSRSNVPGYDRPPARVRRRQATQEGARRIYQDCVTRRCTRAVPDFLSILRVRIEIEDVNRAHGQQCDRLSKRNRVPALRCPPSVVPAVIFVVIHERDPHGRLVVVVKVNLLRCDLTLLRHRRIDRSRHTCRHCVDSCSCRSGRGHREADTEHATNESSEEYEGRQLFAHDRSCFLIGARNLTGLRERRHRAVTAPSPRRHRAVTTKSPSARHRPQVGAHLERGC
jgi:hypothetical protein